MANKQEINPVEITPAMIAAGKDAFYPHSVLNWADTGEVLAKVYLAMSEAHRQDILLADCLGQFPDNQCRSRRLEYKV
jgi:hypothetical protein